MKNRFAATAFALATLGSSLAHPGMLYKSVDTNGVTTFSDTPPAGARIVEERVLSASSSGAPVSVAPSTGNVLVNAEQMLGIDPEVAHANANVDIAERELATARRALSPLFEGARLRPARLSLDDGARLEPYRKSLKIARQQLAEVLRERVRVAPPQLAASLPPVLASQSVVSIRPSTM